MYELKNLLSTDSVPSQEPKKEEPKTSSVYMNEEPAKTDSVPSQEPKRRRSKDIFYQITFVKDIL